MIKRIKPIISDKKNTLKALFEALKTHPYGARVTPIHLGALCLFLIAVIFIFRYMDSASDQYLFIPPKDEPAFMPWGSSEKIKPDNTAINQI